MTTEADRRASFETTFHRHQREVRAYAIRRGAGAAVDDVVAETFLVAWRRWDGVGDDPLPWLFGVARRVLANHHRGERRRLALLDQLLGAREPAFTAPESMADTLAAALAALSATEREALLLVAWEGLTPERGARAAGCSAAAFRVRLHRARRHAAQHLGAGSANPAPAPVYGPSAKETR